MTNTDPKPELPALSPRKTTADVMQLLGPFIGLACVVLLFAIVAYDKNFLSVANFRTVITQTVIVGLGAIGMTYVIIGGGIDLSVGSVIALSCVITAWILDTALPAQVAIPLAMLGGLCVGLVCGVVNGALITSMRMVPFIVTLGMMSIARGAAKYMAGNKAITLSPERRAEIGWMETLIKKVPEPSWMLLSPWVWLTIVLAVLMAFVLRNTVLGAHTFAVGSNESTARLCGVPVARNKLVVYSLCGAFAGLAGVVLFCRLMVGDPTSANAAELKIIAAVVIGGGSLSGGEGRILGSMVGAFMMATLDNGCTLTGIPPSVQDILIGAIIIGAVAMNRLRQKTAG